MQDLRRSRAAADLNFRGIKVTSDEMMLAIFLDQRARSLHVPKFNPGDNINSWLTAHTTERISVISLANAGAITSESTYL